MTSTVTPNFDFPILDTGADVGSWGTALNNGVFSPVDSILGSLTPITGLTTGTTSLSNVQMQSLGFTLAGTLTGDCTIVIPLNNVVSPTVGVGGRFIFVNTTTSSPANSHNVTVKTAASGSVGVVIPQGYAVDVYSDTINVSYATAGTPAFAAASNGNPNGKLAGTAGSVNTNASLAFDYTNGVFYVCTFTGPASGAGQAVWTNPVASNQTQPTPQGYLTPISGTAIIPSDSVSASTIYYTPYTGSWAAVHNGTRIVAYQFSEMSLALNATNQAANGIYDVFLAYNSGSPLIGTGPNWAQSGGSVTAGSCARGTGAGSTALNRDATSGLWVNTNSMTLNPSGSPITVAAGQGVYLGSIYVDSTGGQVSCYRSWGQNRKWGIWNAYNRVSITLQAGDSTVSWLYATATPRPSNNNTANKITTFCGLAEEVCSLSFTQTVGSNNNANNTVLIGMGYNITNGFYGGGGRLSFTAGTVGFDLSGTAQATAPPSLGINNITSLEYPTAGLSVAFNGTQVNMLLLGSYRG